MTVLVKFQIEIRISIELHGNSKFEIEIHVHHHLTLRIWWQNSNSHFLTLKEPGGRNPPPLRHFLLYLCRLLFFRAETSWLFSFKPCARFKTIFIKIRPRVMTRRCVIARWVQRKTDFPLKLHTNRVFWLFCLSGYTSTMFYLIYLVYLE